MFIKTKLLVFFLANLGLLPFALISLFDFGFLYADYNSVVSLIILTELFVGTLLLLYIVYNTRDIKPPKEKIVKS